MLNCRSITGVVYQLSNSSPYDPLVDTVQCSRDVSTYERKCRLGTNQVKATLMKSLGANTIRVSTVNSTSDHTGCMSVFEDAGIYVLIDLGDPTNSFNRVGHQYHSTLSGF
ncbi:MAG: hypothetical protein CL912_16465 [Deltaproteobacteria bacterium]|nr:hypothetical protein [Deltaproteobacteria bacterium]